MVRLIITLTESPWIHTQEQLELTKYALPESRMLQQTWLNTCVVSKGLEEPYHHSSRKERHSENGRMTHE